MSCFCSAAQFISSRANKMWALKSAGSSAKELATDETVYSKEQQTVCDEHLQALWF